MSWFPSFGFGRLYGASEPSRAQKQRPNVTQDIRLTVDTYSWRELMNAGMLIYAGVAPVAGAIDEKALYAVGTGWLPSSGAVDPAWAAQATEWVTGWFKQCDARGSAFDFSTGLRTDSVALDVQGDTLCHLTKNDVGYPLIQGIPAHRIRTRNGLKVVLDGKYTGFAIYNGVILDGNGAAVAFNVLGNTPDEDQIIEAIDCILLYEPKWIDQTARGITALASCVLDCEDWQDVSSYLKQQIKADATETLQIYNEAGQADPGQIYLEGGGSGGLGIQVEDALGGTVRYFRSNSGSKLEALNPNRPGANTTEFLEKLLRNACQGLGWSYDLSRDPSATGGASTRLVSAKCQRTVELRQATLKKKAVRCVAYAVACAIDLGLLPENVDWYKWDFTMPQELSVDAGYQADANREDIAIGTRTMKIDYEQRGLDWRKDGRAQTQIEVDDLTSRALESLQKVKAAGGDLSLDFVVNLYKQLSANPPQQAKQNNTNAASPPQSGSI